MAGDTPRSRKTRSTTTSAGQGAKSFKVSATSSRKNRGSRQGRHHYSPGEYHRESQDGLR